MAQIKIQVREVWQSNFQWELSLIQTAILDFPNVAMDTEFPGTIYPPEPLVAPENISTLPPPQQYAFMKKNVDSLKLIQLGLTLSDDEGNLPYLYGPGYGYVWQFNFRDFDPERDMKNPDSISLLQRQGIDFLKNKIHGIDSRAFAAEFLNKILSLNVVRMGDWSHFTRWVTFHGACDFGYMIKILTGKELPKNLEGFKELVRYYFGEEVFDTKLMGRRFGILGGLNRMAGNLGLVRAAGKCHQAGSDSLLTMQLFLELRRKCERNNINYNNFNYHIYGLGRGDDRFSSSDTA